MREEGGEGMKRGMKDTLAGLATVLGFLAISSMLGASSRGVSEGFDLAGRVGPVGRMGQELLQAGGVRDGSVLDIDVPIQQLSSTKVGDTVQGTLPQGVGSLAWTGKITQHVVISPRQGCVTVQVLSDRYIAPGTEVNGMLGGKNFKGTVTGAPTNLARIGNIERRLGALEPSNHGRIDKLKAKLDRVDIQLESLEGHKTVQQHIEEIEKELVTLEQRPPVKNGMLFAGNVADFSFQGSLGHNDGFRRRVDRLDARLSAIEGRSDPTQAAKPLYKMVSMLENRLKNLQGYGGRVQQMKHMANLEERLAKIEKVYGGKAGDNSKWYGTEEYHGIYKKPEPVKEDEAPAGDY